LTASAFLLFDTSAPYELLTEQALWPMVAEQMPDGAIFDKGQLKPRAEMIVAGHALAPGHLPVTGLKVTARLGSKVKRLAVFGDRFWRLTDRGVEIVGPQPFDKMPISELRAFGGQGHISNPKGKGHKARQLVEAGLDAPLPNIEDADNLILSPEDMPLPAHFGPIGPDNPQRLKLTGTYDKHWQEQVSPCRPADYNPLSHCDAPEDQRFDSYLTGEEVFSITGMSRSGRPVEGTLPDFRMRGFVHRPSDGSLTEMAMVCDTVTLFPNVEKAVLTFRGIARSADRFGDDIGTVMLAVEHGFAEERPVEHYRQVFQLRTDPEEGYKHALSDFQLMPETDPALKLARRETRLERARAEREKFVEDSIWFKERTLQEQGLPKDLLPPGDTSVIDDVPLVGLPTAQELASGDFDLAELIEDIEQLETCLNHKAQKEFARADLTMQTLENKLPDDVRDLLPEQRPASETSLADFPDLELDPEIKAALDGDIPSPDDLKGAINKALDAHDGRFDASDIDARLNEVMETVLNPESTTEDTIAKQCAHGRARAFRLPEGSFLYPIRHEMEQNDLALVSLPDFVQDIGSMVPEHARKTADFNIKDLPQVHNETDFDFNLFSQFPDSAYAMNVDPDLASSKSTAAMKSASDLVAKLNPSLVDANADQPLSKLMSALQSVQTSEPEQDGLSIQDRVRQKCQDLLSSLDQSEQRLEEAFADGRQMSPEALFPSEPYLPEAARKVGAMVRESLAEGHDFKGADLAGLNLRGIDFSGRDLSGTFFERADLSGASFANCCLEGAVFTSATLEEADFTGSILAGANFSGANLRAARLDAARVADCTLLGADLSSAIAHGTALTRLTLMDCKLDYADFRGAQVNDLSLIGGSANYLRFCNASLEQVVFLELHMSEADFSDARLNRAAFTKVEAIDADFSRAHFKEAGFHGNCNLTGARFESVKATDTCWNEALLEEALYLRADCQACLFLKCNMQSVDGRAASFKQSRILQSDLKYSDFCAANFFAASLSQSDLRLVSLRHANLYAADFMEARLASCDLTNANLANTNIAHTSGHMLQ